MAGGGRLPGAPPKGPWCKLIVIELIDGCVNLAVY